MVYAFSGYISTHYQVPYDDVSLDMYLNPTYLARFLGYLTARYVQKGHITKHIGLARKMNDYLQSGSPGTLFRYDPYSHKRKGIQMK